MAPNIIGSTFILAETAISNTDPNNNKATTAAAPATAVAGAAATSVTPNTNKVGSSSSKKDAAQKKPYELEIVWHNILLFIILHSSALYGVYLIFAENAYLEFALCKYPLSGDGCSK